MGRIGKDAVVRHTDNGNTAINFSVCVNIKKRRADGTFTDDAVWYQCVQWVRTGDSVEVAKYLLKGHPVYVEGTVTAEPFIDHSGVAQATLRLKIEKIVLIPGQSPGA